MNPKIPDSDGSKAKQNRGQNYEIFVPEKLKSGFGEEMKNLIQQSFRNSEKGKIPADKETGKVGTHFLPYKEGNNDGDKSVEKFISVFNPNSEHSIPSKPKKTEKLKRSDGMTFAINKTNEELKGRGSMTSAINKTNEELKGRGSIRAGGGAPREFVAYLLDHPKGQRRTGLEDEGAGFAGVPPTLLVLCNKLGHNESTKDSQEANYEDKLENDKVGSLRKHMEDHENCEKLTESDIRNIPREEVHKISLVDIRYANLKRPASDILYHKDEDGKISLVPIHHGNCFPQRFATGEFEWMKWEQAKEAYSPEFKKYIGELDAQKDIALLKELGIEMTYKSERTFRMSTVLLKEGVKKGLTPFQIGNIMCRNTKYRKMSDIEAIAFTTLNDIVVKAMDTEISEGTEKICALEREFREKASPIIRNEKNR